MSYTFFLGKKGWAFPAGENHELGGRASDKGREKTRVRGRT